MKKLQIADQELVTTLRHMAPETGSLICHDSATGASSTRAELDCTRPLDAAMCNHGCGHEHGCSIHGCAVLRAAADRLAEVSAPPPNPPLTLEELRGMDGEPVYLSPGDCWVLTSHNGFVPIFTWPDGSNCSACDWYTQVGMAYRRKPEEANHG